MLHIYAHNLTFHSWFSNERLVITHCQLLFCFVTTLKMTNQFRDRGLPGLHMMVGKFGLLQVKEADPLSLTQRCCGRWGRRRAVARR